MTLNALVRDFGFKRRTKNKEKFIENKKYGIFLNKSFVDINTNEKYKNIEDIIKKFALIDIKRDSEKFHSGLPEQNLKQGSFSEGYKENKQKGEFFISHEKAKKLLEAQFNRHICGPLMVSSSGSDYSYFIKESNYKFRQSDSKILTLTLCYNYKARRGHHDFWMTHVIYVFDKDNFPINRRAEVSVPLDFIIENFTNKP